MHIFSIQQEGMSLYDTVMVGDLSKFGINYVDIECKLEEKPKKAVCAFELLMSKGRSFPKKRKSRYVLPESIQNIKLH